MKVDWLIVGAGFTGSVLAERIATQLGKTVLLVEQRNHIGGNAYDEYDERGILVHRYGPHIFHTHAEYIWDYLSQFTEWRSYYHHVLAVVEGQYVPLPFNLNSIYALFPPRYADRLSQLLIEQYGFNTKIPILKIRENAQEEELKFLAEYVYQNVFHHYTLKQWGITPQQLSPSVTARVPIYISRDNRYFQDKFQGLPKQGYTVLFQRMLSHPRIKILLNTTYQEIATEINYQHLIFTGAMDDFFEHLHGELPYRSLFFKFIDSSQDLLQSVATINYPNEYGYTRTTEFKHLTGQKIDGSVYVEEYSQPYIRGQNIPYYPIPQEKNKDLYNQYVAEADKLKGQVLFAGRLADYQYYNMDQVVARALSLFEKVICKS